MRFLPLTNLGRRLRPKYRLPIYALIFVFVVGSFALSGWFAFWLARKLEIRDGMPVMAQRNGGLWSCLSFAFFIIAVILSYLLSFVFLAAGLKWRYGWTSQRIRGLIFESRIPAHWLDDGTSTYDII